jgi:hypothetical protein
LQFAFGIQHGIYCITGKHVTFLGAEKRAEKKNVKLSFFSNEYRHETRRVVRTAPLRRLTTLPYRRPQLQAEAVVNVKVIVAI